MTSLFVDGICLRKTNCYECDEPILKGEKTIRGLAQLSKHFYSFHKKCYIKVLKENLKELRK